MRRSSRRGKNHEGGAGHERWLVSYADLITLLFALFVVMYASSQADLKKFKEVSEGMQKAFGGSGPAEMKEDVTGAAMRGKVSEEIHPFKDLRGALQQGIGAASDYRVESDEKSVTLKLTTEVGEKSAEALDRVASELASSEEVKGKKTVIRIEVTSLRMDIASARASRIAASWIERYGLMPEQIEAVAKIGERDETRVKVLQ